MESGFVYVLTNPAMPGLVKVGVAQRDVAERVAELSGASGVPLPFEVVTTVPMRDVYAAEKVAHGLLGASRVSPSREFFRVPARFAMWTVRACGERVAAEEVLTTAAKTRVKKGRAGRNMASRELTPDEVVAALEKALVAKPSGRRAGRPYGGAAEAARLLGMDRKAARKRITAMAALDDRVAELLDRLKHDGAKLVIPDRAGRTEAEILADPSLSNVQAAKLLGVSTQTVMRRRKLLQES